MNDIITSSPNSLRQDFSSMVADILPDLPKKEYVGKVDSYSTRSTLRYNYTSNYAWPILTKESMDVLSNILKNKKVVDIAGGMGLLTKLLRQRNTNILLNDITKDDTFYIRNAVHAEIDIVAPAQDVDYSQFDAGVLIWPCYESTWASEVINKLPRDFLLIYQGEGKGGCTANDDFYEILAKRFIYLDDEANRLNKNHIRFVGIHDWWSVYKKI